MKKVVWVALGVLLLLAVVYLVDRDIIHWQPLAIAAAIVAAPLKYLLNIFSREEADIRKTHQKIRQVEADYQKQLEDTLREKRKEIEQLQAELEGLDQKLAALKEARKKIAGHVAAMSDEELMKEWQSRFGEGKDE
ncbi:MAG: hypothetical protein Kow0037_00120 [Calditrichia bacterium]